MREIDLLRAERVVIAETLHQVGCCRLKAGKRLCVKRVIEVVVRREALLVGQPMIDLEGELIGMGILIRNGSELIVRIGETGTVRIGVRTGHKMIHDV